VAIKTIIYGVNPTQPSPIDSKYHYVYRITNLVENKHYYGSRTSDVHPYSDLGIRYFSSSKNKEFKQDQRANPQNYIYKVIHCFDTRTEATAVEVKLHAKHSVSSNPSFYNRANQTSSGFTCIGMINAYNPQTLERTYVNINDTRIKTGELITFSKEMVTVTHSGTKETKQIPRDIFLSSDEFNSVNQGFCVLVDPETGLTQRHSTHNKPQHLHGIRKGFKSAKCTQTGVYTSLPVDDPKWNTGEVVHNSKGMVSVRNTETGVTFQTSKNNPDYLSGKTPHHSKPYARITNGTEECRYLLDGTDVILEGWWICFCNVTLVDVYDFNTHLLAYSKVDSRQFAAQHNLNPNILPKTVHGDFKQKSTSNKPHHHRGLYLRFST
jgi:hypothetical protein